MVVSIGFCLLSENIIMCSVMLSAFESNNPDHPVNDAPLRPLDGYDIQNCLDTKLND